MCRHAHTCMHVHACARATHTYTQIDIHIYTATHRDTVHLIHSLSLLFLVYLLNTEQTSNNLKESYGRVKCGLFLHLSVCLSLSPSLCPSCLPSKEGTIPLHGLLLQNAIGFSLVSPINLFSLSKKHSKTWKQERVGVAGGHVKHAHSQAAFVQAEASRHRCL